jgi:hypothetical protein
VVVLLLRALRHLESAAPVVKPVALAHEWEVVA